MVNLVAGRRVAPELIQNKLSGETLAAEGLSLLGNAAERERMRQGLAELRGKLEGDGDPMERAAQRVARWLPE
jgi:lipid-A-disaccharide synthase